MKGRRGRERRGEVGKEGMVAGWFIACKTPEAGHHIVEAGRSEERRVGKECRSRWSPYH